MPFAGVQQQHCFGCVVDVSSTVVRQQHVLSGPHALAASPELLEETVVISFTSSLMVVGFSFSPVTRLRYSAVPCSIGLLVAVVVFDVVRVDRSDLCSSVKDSSQVTYTVTSSFMSLVCSCRDWNSAYTDESCSENISSCPRLFTTHAKRT